jgi:hypothetical protein
MGCSAGRKIGPMKDPQNIKVYVLIVFDIRPITLQCQPRRTVRAFNSSHATDLGAWNGHE